jgi:hypothetical protein
MVPALQPRRIGVQIGNSPTMVHKAQFAAMLPRWDCTVRAIHADADADKDLGWAQEMFAFALALANTLDEAAAGQGSSGRLISGKADEGARVEYHDEWMVQPPFTQKLQYDPCQVRG